MAKKKTVQKQEVVEQEFQETVQDPIPEVEPVEPVVEEKIEPVVEPVEIPEPVKETVKEPEKKLNEEEYAYICKLVEKGHIVKDIVAKLKIKFGTEKNILEEFSKSKSISELLMKLKNHI